jgi:predicted ATPase
MFIGKIKLENILSFKDAELELRPLNVLIGANASGKSNLIRILGLVKSLPRDLQKEIADGGGPGAWINRTTNGRSKITLLNVWGLWSYAVAFQPAGPTYEIAEEYLVDVFERAFAELKLAGENEAKGLPSLMQSVLAQLRIPGHQIGTLAGSFESIRLYREFKTGPGTQARQGINTSALAESLSEEGGNLALVLDRLNLHDRLNRVNEVLHRFCDLFSRVLTSNSGGIAQLYIIEEGTGSFSALSLSDGTLRLLCLLAVLLDPAPPPLVCIEEPEVGMHPDAIRMIADLLVEASSKTQLIVTTHSPALVDALSDQPESVVVCERDFDGFTEFRRLQNSDLDKWLERYSLGELWQKGEIGGNRW